MTNIENQEVDVLDQEESMQSEVVLQVAPEITEKRKKEADIEICNNWHLLGDREVTIDVPLTPQEMIDTGFTLNSHLMNVGTLKSRLAEIKRNFKFDIETEMEAVEAQSSRLDSGVKPVKVISSCFAEPTTKRKHYMNIETGEIYKSENMEQKDFQPSMFK